MTHRSQDNTEYGGRAYHRDSVATRIRDMAKRNPSFSAKMLAEFCGCARTDIYGVLPEREWTGRSENIPRPRSEVDNILKASFRAVFGRDPWSDVA